MHAVRDCYVAKQVWCSVGGELVNDQFFSLQCNEWVERNLCRGDPWARIFAVTIWWQWHWRNKMLFEEGFEFPNRAYLIIKKYVGELENLVGCYGSLCRRRKTVEVK